MNKQLGATMIVAGTCIGAGVIALPLTLATLGILWSFALMLCVWIVTYYSALINLELVLQAKKPLNIGKLGMLYSGRVASVIGTSTLNGLMFALMAAYIYGIASLVCNLTPALSQKMITIAAAAFAYLFLILPVQKVDAANRVLFTCMLVVAGILVFALASSVNFSKVNLISSQIDRLPSWIGVSPVIFTSFGFQVLFHTLSEYCDMNAKVLKKVFFVGSLIPLIIYSIWTCSVLYVIYTNDSAFYLNIVQGKVEIGKLIQKLSAISNAKYLQGVVWVVSFLAVITSTIGVGLGLCDSLKQYIGAERTKAAAAIAIVPPCLIALAVPNAFIALLGCAGMILSVLAILLPLYLLVKASFATPFYKATSKTTLLVGAGLFGLAIIFCELWNMMI
ncbi:MAG: hypothetical protein LBF72_01305 [Holosporales bacterium]|jgi:tyrosine-specific transport protein|nr:hypothetical protein [Holosporales bacterium]